jgi:hypothetical protein
MTYRGLLKDILIVLSLYPVALVVWLATYLAPSPPALRIRKERRK